MLPLFLALSLILTGSGFGFSQASSQVVNNKTFEHVAGEFLVKFKNDEEIYKFKTDHDANIYEIIDDYQNMEAVEFIEPNFVVQAMAFPNDPDFSLQWYLNAIKAKDAWSKELFVRQNEGITSRSVIAILDTGVDLDHPDLAGKIWSNKNEAPNGLDDDGNGYVDDLVGWDFASNNNDPDASFDNGYNPEAVKHGTLVAGIAAAVTNNNQGISGVSWFSDIMPLRVLDSTGAGDIFSVIRAIDYASNNGADVINMSFVGSGFSQALSNAIANAYNNDVVIVAAAGNTNPETNGINLDVEKAYPVCYDSAGQNRVLGVAAVGSGLKKSNFSNYGSCIDLVAPGESFWTTQPFQVGIDGFTKYYDGFWSGTSLSAPLVSGTAGMIKALRPGFSNQDIQRFILNSAVEVDTFNQDYQGQLGRGLLNTATALDAALKEKAPAVGRGFNNYIVAGLGAGSLPQIKILNSDGSVYKEFFAYSPYFTGEINVAVGDIDLDGSEEVITGAGAGGGPHVRAFNVNGILKRQFFAYDPNSRGGVNIAVADVTGDGADEIITGPGRGEKPLIKVFNQTGEVISSFLAYDENFTGGVNVAAGDFNHDGKAEIVTGAGSSGGPHVRVFDYAGNVISQFFAFNQVFTGGVNVAVGDLHGDGQNEVIVSPESKSVPTVKIFNYRGGLLASILAFEQDYFGGVNVAVKDLDGDGAGEVIVGRSFGYDSLIKAFDISGVIKASFDVHLRNYRGGVRLSGISD